MIKIISATTTIETRLPGIVNRLELISPFIFTKICIIDQNSHAIFELMSLEWLQELNKFFGLDLQIPMDYKANLTSSGEQFYIRVLQKNSLEISIYDQNNGKERILTFTDVEFLVFIRAIYDQLTENFASQGSSQAPIEAHRVQTLAAFSAWQDRTGTRGELRSNDI